MKTRTVVHLKVPESHLLGIRGEKLRPALGKGRARSPTLFQPGVFEDQDEFCLLPIETLNMRRAGESSGPYAELDLTRMVLRSK